MRNVALDKVSRDLAGALKIPSIDQAEGGVYLAGKRKRTTRGTTTRGTTTRRTTTRRRKGGPLTKTKGKELMKKSWRLANKMPGKASKNIGKAMRKVWKKM